MGIHNKKNINLNNILKQSIYPFQFNKDTGHTLKQSYILMFSKYILVKDNKNEFTKVLNWNNDQYSQFLYNNLLICDQIYMLTHTYLKYPQETIVFNNILMELESLYLYLFIEDEAFKHSDLICEYYNTMLNLYKIYTNYKQFYIKEVNLGLSQEDKLIKHSEKVYSLNGKT